MPRSAANGRETVQMLVREVGATENKMKMVALREESEDDPRWKGHDEFRTVHRGFCKIMNWPT